MLKNRFFNRAWFVLVRPTAGLIEKFLGESVSIFYYRRRRRCRVEQEVLARVINEVYASKSGAERARAAAAAARGETVPHSAPLPRRAKNRAYEEVVASVAEDSTDASGHDSLIGTCSCRVLNLYFKKNFFFRSKATVVTSDILCSL